MTDDFQSSGAGDAATDSGLDDISASLSVGGVGEAAAKRVTAAALSASGGAPVILGKQLDVETGALTVPARAAHRHMVAALVACELLAAGGPWAEAVDSSTLRKVAGRLEWLAGASLQGTAHVSEVWAAASAPSLATRAAHLPGALADLQWWAAAWGSAAGVAPRRLLAPRLVPDGLSVFFSDASQHAGGAILRDRALYRLFTPADVAAGIACMEFLMTVLGVEVLGAAVRGQLVVISTDSACNAAALVKGRIGGGAAGAALMARLLAAAQLFGLDFLVVWLPREFNTVADTLSYAPTFSAASLALAACRPGVALGDVTSARGCA